MKSLGIVILFLVALMAGGCSIVSILSFGSDSFILSLPGLGVALVCGLGIRALTRGDPPEPPGDAKE